MKKINYNKLFLFSNLTFKSNCFCSCNSHWCKNINLWHDMVTGSILDFFDFQIVNQNWLYPSVYCRIKHLYIYHRKYFYKVFYSVVNGWATCCFLHYHNSNYPHKDVKYVFKVFTVTNWDVRNAVGKFRTNLDQV